MRFFIGKIFKNNFRNRLTHGVKMIFFSEQMGLAFKGKMIIL